MATFRRKHRYLAMVVGVAAVLAVLSGIVFVNASGPKSGQSLGVVTTDTTDSTTTATSTTTTAVTTVTPSDPVRSPLSQVSAEPKVDPKAFESVAANGTTPVILILDITPTGTDAEKAAQVSERLDQVLGTLPLGSYSKVSRDLTVQTVPVTVNADGLNAMAISPFVNSVKASREFSPTAATNGVSPAFTTSSAAATTESGANVAWAAGKKGAGATVAVVDTGVDVNHPFFAGKTIWEGCFASPTVIYSSPCPGGQPMGVSDAPLPGSATPCPVSRVDCAHGTHVAGIAVGGSGSNAVSGIAPSASLVAINVFSFSGTKISSNDADLIDALQWLYNKRTTFTGLSSVNLSLGDGSLHTGSCDSDPLKPLVDLLAGAGIATVIAAGNESRSTGVSAPGCISTAITVGAIDDLTGQSTYFSNDGPQVDVMAPGLSICSSVPTNSTLGSACSGPTAGTFQSVSGTSMATPAVAGALAVLAGNGVPYSERKSRLQRVAQGSNCVQASAYTIPMLRVDVALGLSSQMAAPCAPSSPSATLTSGSSATISWLAPIAAGTGTLLSYTATSSSGQSCTVSAPSASCTVSGLPGPSTVTFTVKAQSTTGISSASIPSNSVAPTQTSTGMVPLTPARLVDTRLPSNYGTTIDDVNLGHGPVGQGQTYDVQIAGRGGLGAAGFVAAVALNITVVSPTASSYITAYPTGMQLPLASNLNFVAGQTIPNMAIVKVGAGGQISIYNNTGSTDVIVDVVGWFPVGSAYTGVNPQRMLDTRSSGSPNYGGPTIDELYQNTGALAAGQTFVLPVTGRGTIPASGVGAVAINVTVVGPTVGNFVSVFPGDTSLGGTSNINFSAGQTIANMVITKVSAAGTIAIYNNAGATQIVVDVVGWFPTVSDFHSFAPQRFVDTRAPGYPSYGGSTIDGQYQAIGPIVPGGYLDLTMLGRGSIPASGVGAVALNVTVVGSTGSNYLTVYPFGGIEPTVSNLNFVAGDTIANMVIVKLGAGGKITIYNNAGNTPVLVDVVGWFAS